VVDSSVHGHKALQTGLVLHVRVVETRVEHDDGEGQDVARVCNTHTYTHTHTHTHTHIHTGSFLQLCIVVNEYFIFYFRLRGVVPWWSGERMQL